MVKWFPSNGAIKKELVLGAVYAVGTFVAMRLLKKYFDSKQAGQ